MKRELPPLRERPADWVAFEEYLRQLLRLEFYLPLVRTIKATRVLNSDPSFNALASRLDEALSRVLPAEVAGKLSAFKFFDRALFRVDRQFRKNVRKVALVPELSEAARAVLAKEYAESLQLPIQGWVAEEVEKLRKKVQAHVLRGGREAALVRALQTSYSASRKKAQFWAHQETSLILSKFKAARYQDAGIREYRWRCVVGSPAHPVRPLHKELNDRSLKGETFRWDDPPIDSPDGSRHNPGENYNCRCSAIPVVDFSR